MPENRTKRPTPNPKYPSKQQLALDLLEEFAKNNPKIKIQSVLADALYGNAHFMDTASRITSCTQAISQLRKNQLVRSRGKNVSVTTYFARNKGFINTLTIRGGDVKKVNIQSARLMVKSQEKKRFIVATVDLTWRHNNKDIAQTYTLRWLVEVFIQDWKGHGGWDTLSKQHGEDGATHGITLSLLCDHLLLLTHYNPPVLKTNNPGCPLVA